MRTRQTELHYRERVARAVAAIVANPLAEHRLEDLARLAYFSPFHFHRVYRSVAGETVANTVRRVRLAQATRLLAQGGQSVTQVGLAVGYDSPQAFTRAFGQFTGQSPRHFQHQMQREIGAGLVPLAHHEVGGEATVRIVERPTQMVHALRHAGPFSTIPHTHRQLRAYVGVRPVHSWLGVSCGDPEHAPTFCYYAAATMSQDYPLAGVPMVPLLIPGGLYAIHRLVGPYTRIHTTVRALLAQWLPTSGYRLDDRPLLEHYLNSPRQVPAAALLTDLLIPVRPTC